MNQSRNPGQGGDPTGESGPTSALSKYAPAAAPVRVRDPQPPMPNPAKPDPRMLQGPARQVTVKATNKNTVKKALHGTGGPTLNRPGVPGSRTTKGQL